MVTKKTTNRTTTTRAAVAQTMGEGAVRDIVNQVVREAFRSHARELEQHLNNINDRLLDLEKR